ncbi:MAG: hypothetical protein JJT75_12885 [Opitutales bacterium]|nr:hypothetical protein [Opitutales bacterium]MCH8540467.1 hypothetical protein [Opitutales bacterium]
MKAKPIFFTALLSLGIFLMNEVSVGLQAQSLPSSWREATRSHQHERDPLEVTGVRASSLTGRDSDTLYFRDRGATVQVPINSVQQMNFVATTDARRGVENFQAENYSDAVRQLGPFARRVVHYVDVPNSNAVTIVNMYITALSRAQHFDEAEAFLLLVPLEGEGEAFVPQIFEVAESMRLAERDYMDLIRRVPISPENTRYVLFMREFAESLLEQDAIEDASLIYRRVREATDGEDRRWATIWMAYAEVRSGGTFRAAELLDEVGELEVSEAVYSLYYLIRSRLSRENENFDDAIDEISRGIVYANINTAWFPEMLYLSAISYREAGNIETASRVGEYLSMLFPENYWTNRLEREG